MSFLTGRILPIVVIDSPADAEPLAEALLAGGTRQVEVTLRTPAALEAIRRMAAYEELVVGVGTAVTVEQVEQAVEAGARFVVSPGLIEPVVERSLALGLPPVPGIATATELSRATAFGLDLLKLFPAEQLGGVGLISAYAAVFPGIRFMPSGGTRPDNAPSYLRHPAVAAVGGSWLAPREAIRGGDFALITRLCAAAEELVP